MASVFTIFWRDFRADFLALKTSAVAFFFLIFMGAFFFNYVDTFVSMQNQAPSVGGELPPLSQLIAALFGILHFVLILIVPAVTMSSFAEESRQQTMRLLQSAPIASWQVVVGKFLAVAALMLCVLIASLVFPLFLWAHGRPDLGVIFASYLGLYLLICSQLAFGLWVSSLTSNQFMAFLFTMFGLFLLLIVNSLAASLKAYTFVHRAIKYLGASEHVAAFFKGLITVSDTSYFVLFTVFFLFLTQVSFDSLRWR